MYIYLFDKKLSVEPKNRKEIFIQNKIKNNQHNLILKYFNNDGNTKY